jgi:hypothetical protein
VAPNGGLLWTGTGAGSFNDGANRHTRRVVVIADSGASKELGTYPMTEIIFREFGFRNPFYPAAYAGLASDGRVAISDSLRWEIRTYSAEGQLERVIRAPIRRRPVDDDAIAHRRAAIDEYGEVFGVRPSERHKVERAMLLPDSLPAIRTLWFSPDGGIWAGKQDALGWLDGYEVFDSDGRWIATVEIPGKSLQLLGVGDDVVTTRETDELGVQRVRVRRIVRPEGNPT